MKSDKERIKALEKQYDECEAALVKMTEEFEKQKSELKDLKQIIKLEKEFDETPRPIKILDESGNMLLAGDNQRRFFEAAWLHKHNGKYYFSYSTGDTHFICYAIGDNPYGPFFYAGRILNPVVGWTTHHSICKIENKILSRIY